MEKFDWNDISIIPDEISNISSRSEINYKYEDGKLPLFAAPMDMVISKENVNKFYNRGINICLPRNIKWEDLENENYFYSYGLDEIINLFENSSFIPPKVLIDVANGNMTKLLDVSTRIKKVFGDKIELMVGNIANPKTYKHYCEAGIDYVRAGIGGGSSCFVGDTTIITKNGNKKISDINNGDFVLTHNGEFKTVINTIIYNTDEDLIKINGNISTKNHEYYVLDKKYLDIVDDDNIHEYAKFIEASKLDIEKHLLIELDNDV